MLAANEVIAKITRTSLGYEDHGILTIMLTLDYGKGGGIQGAGGYALDEPSGASNYGRKPTVQCGRWVQEILAVCGVNEWERVKGCTVIAIRDTEDKWGGFVIGLRSLPTEGNHTFMFKAEDD